MMYIISDRYGEIQWHVGCEKLAPEHVPTVTEIQVDGDELRAIVRQGLFVIPQNNIAMPIPNVWRIFGDQAKFIVANLVSR